LAWRSGCGSRKADVTDVTEEARPFLKWAGGKRQLLPVLRRFYPARFTRYWEPFLGSAAVFFDLQAHGRLDGRAAILGDTNEDLIACYAAVRDRVDEVIDELSALAQGHAKRGAAHYYEVRDKRFNVGRQGAARHAPSFAAMFIYLNRTGYNGLFRLNAHGEFNVPVGRYPKPRICDTDNLRRVSLALGQPSIALERQRFDRVMDEARAGDFVYFDPPYAPLTRTARFTSYTAEGFTRDDQQKLRQIVIGLATRGCSVVLSNSTAPEIVELYERDQNVAAAGLRCHTVPARRAINSNGKRRGAVNEYVITNVVSSSSELSPGFSEDL
jgi:DNA adenine methylase